MRFQHCRWWLHVHYYTGSKTINLNLRLFSFPFLFLFLSLFFFFWCQFLGDCFSLLALCLRGWLFLAIFICIYALNVMSSYFMKYFCYGKPPAVPCKGTCWVGSSWSISERLVLRGGSPGTCSGWARWKQSEAWWAVLKGVALALIRVCMD